MFLSKIEFRVFVVIANNLDRRTKFFNHSLQGNNVIKQCLLTFFYILSNLLSNTLIPSSANSSCGIGGLDQDLVVYNTNCWSGSCLDMICLLSVLHDTQ